MLTQRVRYGMMAGGVVLLSGIGAAGFGTYHYVEKDPGFCTNCHIMDDAFQRWSKSEHSKINCHDCHAPDIKANLRQLYVYLTDPPQKPSHAPELENSVCYSCHRVEPEEGEKLDGKWQQVLFEAGHAEHVGKQKIQCVRCHSTSLHKFTPPSEICKGCHKHNSMEGTSMDQHCTTCHAFKATERGSLLPTRGDCLECHKEMQVKGEVFPETQNGVDKPVMHWDCGKCHKPHSQLRPDTALCKSCHEEKLATSDIHRVKAHTDCLTCHKPHLWKVTTSTPCLSCHKDREKHADGELCASCHE